MSGRMLTSRYSLARYKKTKFCTCRRRTLLVWVISGEANIEERELTGPWEQSKARAGTFYLTQTDTPYLMRWQGKDDTCFEVLHLYLGLELVNRAGMSLNLTSSRIRMRDVSGGQDVFISGILSGLVAEMQSPAIANPLFVNGLLESLTVHLLRQYADTKSEAKPRSTLLPTWKLRRVLEHMEAHLAEPFDLDCLAALCGMSRFHFSRSFRTTTGQTPLVGSCSTASRKHQKCFVRPIFPLSRLPWGSDTTVQVTLLRSSAE